MSNCGCLLNDDGASIGPTLASTCGGSAFLVFMGLLEVFLRSQCDLSDPCRKAKLRPNIDSEFDFIVVGGGSAGAVVASRLSEIAEWSVLLIEAGVEEPIGSQVPSMFLNFIGSSIDWGYRTEPESMACLNEKEQRCYWPRGKVLGGTSVMNGMMYIRGSRQDFNAWSNNGNYGWSFEEVLPYFKMSENNLQMAEFNEFDKEFHASGGPLPITQFPYNPPLAYSILKAGQELGYYSGDLNGAKRTGFAIAQTTSFNGTRVSSSRAFLRPNMDRPNLKILLNHTVSRVLIDRNGKVAKGVEIITPDGDSKTVYATKEVVLSAGAVASPQVLLLSGIGPIDDLRNVGIEPIHDLAGVGKNLHNHVAFFMNFFIRDKNTAPLNWATAMEYMLYRDGLMSGTGISDVTALVHSRFSDPKQDDPDIQLFFGGFLANCARTGQVGEELGHTDRQIQIIPTVLQPKSRGFLTLNDSNPSSAPRIYANYLTHDDDVQTLIDGIRFVQKLAKTEALQKYKIRLDRTPVKNCERLEFNSDRYWECAIRHQTGPENHQVGSNKMGPETDRMAVVSPELKVHGVRNLRVIDASIMPRITSGNTHAPTVMIAEKGSRMIVEFWRQKALSENLLPALRKRAFFV